MAAKSGEKDWVVSDAEMEAEPGAELEAEAGLESSFEEQWTSAEEGDWDMDALEIDTCEPSPLAVTRVLKSQIPEDRGEGEEPMVLLSSDMAFISQLQQRKQGDDAPKPDSERVLGQVEGVCFDLYGVLLTHNLVSDKKLRAADSKPAWVCFECGFVNRLIEDFDCRRRVCGQRRPDEVRVFFGNVDDPSDDALIGEAPHCELVWACECGNRNAVADVICQLCTQRKGDDCVEFQGNPDDVRPDIAPVPVSDEHKFPDYNESDFEMKDDLKPVANPIFPKQEPVFHEMKDASAPVASVRLPEFDFSRLSLAPT